MDQFPPDNVYRNIEKFLKYRHIETTHKFLDSSAFLNELTNQGFIVIRGSCSDRFGSRQVVILLFAPESPAIAQSQAAKVLLAKVLGKVSTAKSPDVPNDLIIVTEFPMAGRVIDVYAQYKPEYRIELLQYKRFCTEIPVHAAVPPHEIVAREEIEALLQKFHKNYESLKRIQESDPACVWLGARAGDVVKVTCPSETAGVAVVYRIVI